MIFLNSGSEANLHRYFFSMIKLFGSLMHQKFYSVSRCIENKTWKVILRSHYSIFRVIFLIRKINLKLFKNAEFYEVTRLKVVTFNSKNNLLVIYFVKMKRVIYLSSDLI
jgi:hypothetical protein